MFGEIERQSISDNPEFLNGVRELEKTPKDQLLEYQKTLLKRIQANKDAIRLKESNIEQIRGDVDRTDELEILRAELRQKQMVLADTQLNLSAVETALQKIENTPHNL